MALSKNPESYSFTVRSIIDYFALDQEAAPALVFDFDNIKQARHFRFQFYGFKNALRGAQAFAQEAAVAELLIVTIPDTWMLEPGVKPKVRFELRDLQAQNVQLMEVINKQRAQLQAKLNGAEAEATEAKATEAKISGLGTPYEPTHDEVLAGYLKK